jgi:TM2 domain-containing membrane protein YozV
MSPASMLSRESRWLRLGGIALILIAMAGFAIFEELAKPQAIFQSADRSRLPWIALVFFVLANVFALGLVLLLAGLRQLSLRTSAQARRGAMVRMAAVNLILPCFAFVAVDDSGSLDEISGTWYVAVPLLVAFVLVARASIRLFRSAWKHEAQSAQEALASDPRRPVVYLRSFGVDDQLLVTTGRLGGRLASLFMYTASVSPEQEMAFMLERIGPVIAIGKPGERLPELGAARRYVGDDEWRQVVDQLMNDAVLVVIRAGETANLWWETQEALTRCPRERVVIVALGPAETFMTFERRFSEAYGRPATTPAPQAWLRATLLRLAFPYARASGKIIYFDKHARPHEEPIWYRLTWAGFVLSPYRPYRDSLQAAFRTVFAALGLRPVAKRTQTTAVLLALFAGIIGLHQFYMGHRRRGVWYLAFCWLAFPMILGWIDAVRLALLDETQFQARLTTGPFHQA